MHVQSLLSRKARGPATLGPMTGLSDAAGLLALDHCEIVVIADEIGKILGVITDGDILRRVARARHGADPCGARVDEVMTRKVVTCAPHDSLERVLGIMKASGLRRLPVSDSEGRLLGVVTLQDVLASLYEETRLEEDLLKEYVFGCGYR